MQFLNSTLETMTPYLMNRTRVIYGNQQKRCREHSGRSLPYTLTELRQHVILPSINDPRCVYCRAIVISESSFQVDHAMPLSRGGTWALSNLIICCPSCNAAKGCMSAEEFMAFLNLIFTMHPFAAKDILRRLKIGGNPMAARLCK